MATARYLMFPVIRSRGCVCIATNFQVYHRFKFGNGLWVCEWHRKRSFLNYLCLPFLPFSLCNIRVQSSSLSQRRSRLCHCKYGYLSENRELRVWVVEIDASVFSGKKKKDLHSGTNDKNILLFSVQCKAWNLHAYLKGYKGGARRLWNILNRFKTQTSIN